MSTFEAFGRTFPLEYLLWLGLAELTALALAVGVIGVVIAVRIGEQQVDASIERAFGPVAPAPLPQRVPGATLVDHYADDTLALFGPIPEPLAYGAQVVDHDAMTWTRACLPSQVPGLWRSEHGVFLFWDALRLRHPELTDPGVPEEQRLQLADDSIPLEDIPVENLAFVGAVLADIDDLAATDGEQR